MSARRLILTPVLLVAAGLAPVLGGCSDASDPCLVEVPAGRIRGRVLSGGMPMDAIVSATRIVDGEASEFDFESEVGAGGSYALDVPAGRYTVSLRIGWNHTTYDYTSGGLGYGNLAPDTLQVDRLTSPLTIDFVLGAIALQLELSPRLDGEVAEVQLYRRDAEGAEGRQSYADWADDDIEQGRAELRLPGVLPGEYQVEIVIGRRCYCAAGGEHFWLPGTRDRSASPWYTIGPDEVAPLSCEIVSDPPRLEGRIAGAWLSLGLPDPPELFIVDPDSTLIMGRRQVGSDGSFAIDLHLLGPVKIGVRHYGGMQWVGGPAFDDATTYTLRLGETIADIELVQSGLRFDADLPATLPVSDGGAAAFEFYDPVDLSLLTTVVVPLGQGAVGVPNLWPGEFLVRVAHGQLESGIQYDAPSWRPQWYDRVSVPEQAVPIAITAAGEVVRRALTLELGGVIRGRVEPALSFRYVVLTRADACERLDSTYTWDRQPEFTFRGLADGDYKVGALPYGSSWSPPDPPPAGTVWYPGTTSWSEAAVVGIREAGEVAGIVIRVP